MHFLPQTPHFFSIKAVFGTATLLHHSGSVGAKAGSDLCELRPFRQLVTVEEESWNSHGQISALALRDASWPIGNLWDSFLTHNCELLDGVEEERNNFIAINHEKPKYSFLYYINLLRISLKTKKKPLNIKKTLNVNYQKDILSCARKNNKKNDKKPWLSMAWTALAFKAYIIY